MTKNLEGKVALVTGASKGIGAEIARQLAAAGASVAVNYSSSKEGADRVVAEIAVNGGKAVAIRANVTNPAEVQGLIAATKKAFGALDILVNNAGIYEFSPLDGITPEHFHRHFDLNVLGLLLVSLAKELAPRKIRVNAVNPGMIVTEGMQSAGLDKGAMRDWIEATTPLARVGTVQEIAGPVVFLASDEASYITGETLQVTGGLT
ncbi:MAG: short-chain dehydrogenase [Geobacteraceae bacterium GWC2_58_44]|nr:MAG: short-chain dehydrogenase [Geobacteraceae bacterium GWC2_58_44]HBG07961.1 short-chain dehydrogenase [Geobacter sp.]